MINYNRIINKILKFDQLHFNIDLNRFNEEEKEMLKLVCYKNQQLNFQYNYIKPFNKRIYFLLFKIRKIIPIRKNVKIIFTTILRLFKKEKPLNIIDADIIFIISLAANIQRDTVPIINNFSKKIILIDVPFKKHKSYKEVFKNSKIINIREHIRANDYFLAIFKTLIFLTKFFMFRKTNTHPLMNFATYFNFFLRVETYKKIIKNIKVNKIFIDRNDGQGISFFISKFKKKNKKNKVFSYSPVGLALNNDLISAHYLYENLDYLFCYGELDKIFLKRLFQRNKLKLLKIPNKIIPVGSVRNFSYKIKNKKKLLQNKKKLLQNKKKLLQNKKFNFLYIKSNPNSFFYDNLDYKCFKQFCFFINKHFPKSNILVKERYGQTSKTNDIFIKKKIIRKENIYDTDKMVPEELFEKADFVVGTTSSSLAMAIYYNIPVICLDNKIIISSLLKFFCYIYVNSINDIKNCKSKIIKIYNSPKINFQKKNILFEPIKNPHLKISNFIKKNKN
jgi:hypothetical protein